MRMRRIPNLTPQLLTRRPETKVLAGVIPAALALATLIVAVSPWVQARLAWVPVEHDTRVVDALLTVIVGLFFMVVAVAIVLPLSLALHQVGHALGGQVVGMWILTVRVGPLLIQPGSATGVMTRLAVRRREDILTAWTHLDDTPLPAWRRPRGWMIVLAAGPALNLVVAIVCAVWSIFAGPVAYVLLRELVWINLAIGVATLAPVAVPGRGQSDGRRLLTLLQDDNAADTLLDELRNQIVVGPTRPAAWPREWLTAWEDAVRRPATDGSGSEERLELSVYLMLHALDRGDRPLAQQWSHALQVQLDDAAGGGTVAGELARVVLALHAARWEEDAETARRHLDRIDGDSEIVTGPWYRAALAAVQLAEANPEGPGRESQLLAASAIAEEAMVALAEPAKLHGVDQLMLGMAQGIVGDAAVDRQRRAYAAEVMAA